MVFIIDMIKNKSGVVSLQMMGAAHVPIFDCLPSSYYGDTPEPDASPFAITDKDFQYIFGKLGLFFLREPLPINSGDSTCNEMPRTLLGIVAGPLRTQTHNSSKVKWATADMLTG